MQRFGLHIRAGRDLDTLETKSSIVDDKVKAENKPIDMTRWFT